MIISNESMNYKDPKESDDPQLFHDPQLFDDQLEVWTLIIEKSTVIPPSLMVLSLFLTSISVSSKLHFQHQQDMSVLFSLRSG